MEFWNNIINTAMIGTDKKNIGANELPAPLARAALLINANENIDREEKFLQIAAVAVNYRRSGILPLYKESVTLSQCPAEEKLYCNATATQVLKDILAENSIPLLKYWLQQADIKNRVAEPGMIPTLLEKGTQQKTLQSLISRCCGKRGQWLSQFNEVWNFSGDQTAEQCWQTGNPEQRKAVLKEIRTNDPALAREWLQQTWSQEDANAKANFLELFSINTSEADIPFLASLSAEKAKKVKEEVAGLLKKIPGSPVVQLYGQLLQQTVQLKKEKIMFGLSGKMALQFQLPVSAGEDIFKTGIEKLSNSKEFTDDEFIIYQLIQAVPPSFWEKHFNSKPEEIVHYFQKDNTGKKMIPALVIATSKFKDEAWAFMFMQSAKIFYPEILPLLPEQEQEHYSNRFFAEDADSIIQFAVRRPSEWGMELTKNIFRHIAKNPYRYSRSFFNQQIHLVPITIVAELEKCTPQDEQLRITWSNSADYIIKLISLKIQTIKAFNG